MLLPDEWRLLEAAALQGPERFGMEGTERMLLYRTAIETGLRSSELRSLTRGNLFHRADSPFITCKAGSTKNRQNYWIFPLVAATSLNGRPKRFSKWTRTR